MTDPLTEVLPQIKQLAAEKGIEDLKIARESVQLYRGGSWDARPGGLEISGKYQGSRAAEKDEFEKKTNELLSAKTIECEMELKPNLKGMKFPKITKARAVMVDGAQDQDIGPQPNEVTLFDF